MAFRIGQKVVCIDDDGRSRHPVALDWSRKYITRGKVYTVAAVASSWIDGSPSVTLVETGSKTFFARRFRPIAERKTDISALKALLTPTRERVT